MTENGQAHDVILQVLSDTWKFHLDGDTCGFKDILGTDAAQHEDLWTSYGASGENDLLVGVDRLCSST